MTTNAKYFTFDGRMGAVVLWLIVISPIIATALGAGVTRGFIADFDADLHYVYRALRMNQGLPQIHFDHTGYTYTLFLSWWTNLLHHLGLLPAVTLDAVRASADGVQEIVRLVHAGRVFSVLLSMLYVTLFVVAAIRITGERVLGFALGALVASAPGTVLHGTFLRPEMISALGVMISFLALAVSTRATRAGAFFWLAVAAGGVYFGAMGKIQAIIPALLLPAFGLTLGRREAPAPMLLAPDPARAVAAFALVAVLAAALTLVHVYGLKADFHPEKGVPAYAWGVAAYVVLCIGLYAYLYGKGPAFFGCALGAVVVGVAFAFTLNFFQHALSNSGAIAGFLDKMMAFADMKSGGDAGTTVYAELLARVWRQVPLTAKALFMDDPWLGAGRAVVLTALAYAMVRLWRAGQRRTALSLFVLLAGALGITLAFSLRGLLPQYDVYFIFLWVLGLAMGFAALEDAWKRRTAPVLIAACAALFVVQGALNIDRFGTSRLYPWKYMDSRKFCEWNGVDAPILHPDTYKGNACWPLYRRAIPQGDKSLDIIGD